MQRYSLYYSVLLSCLKYFVTLENIMTKANGKAGKLLQCVEYTKRLYPKYIKHYLQAITTKKDKYSNRKSKQRLGIGKITKEETHQTNNHKIGPLPGIGGLVEKHSQATPGVSKKLSLSATVRHST